MKAAVYAKCSYNWNFVKNNDKIKDKSTGSKTNYN